MITLIKDNRHMRSRIIVLDRKSDKNATISIIPKKTTEEVIE